MSYVCTCGNSTNLAFCEPCKLRDIREHARKTRGPSENEDIEQIAAEAREQGRQQERAAIVNDLVALANALDDACKRRDGIAIGGRLWLLKAAERYARGEHRTGGG